MGLKKKWWWDKVDWDKEIQENGITVDQRDIPHMNATEIVEILNLMGIRAHRGMSIDILRRTLQRGEKQRIAHPMDKWRDKIVAFLSKNWDKIRDQLLTHCHGDCYQHHDAEVTACYVASRPALEKK